MRQNNFDIVRLFLACMVVLAHAADLSASPALASIPQYISRHLAVESFFAISGFLIFASYERSSSLREYATNRAIRILPGYWLSTLVCIGLALGYGATHFAGFLAANLTFLNYLHPGIPGVFESNPGNAAMNGALWTIKIEVMFYLAVPLIVWLSRRLRHRDLMFGSLYAASILYRISLQHRYPALAGQLPGQLAFFMAGALVFYHFDRFKQRPAYTILASVALYVAHLATGWFLFRPAAIAGLVLSVCLLLPQIKGPTRYGDFSYGTYILHYPILQLLVAAGLFRVHPVLALLPTAVIVASAAVISWYAIEKPALTHAKSRRLRQAALGATANYPAAVP